MNNDKEDLVNFDFAFPEKQQNQLTSQIHQWCKVEERTRKREGKLPKERNSGRGI